MTALTIVAAPSSTIDGVIAKAPSWDELDAREIGYDRHRLMDPLRDHASDEVIDKDVNVYRSKPECLGLPCPGFPIWRSYVDAVLQGYLRQFGDGGLQRFMATTDGWSRHLVDDREAPRYPRAVQLDPREVELFDELIAGRME